MVGTYCNARDHCIRITELCKGSGITERSKSSFGGAFGYVYAFVVQKYISR